MKLLVVVEDDHDMQLLIEITLGDDERLNCAGRASTADEAVEIARREQPDLIILDHFIEGDVMGLDAAPRLKEAAPKATILLFSSHDLEIEATREPAIDEYLPKRNIRDLLPTVQRLLGLDTRAA